MIKPFLSGTALLVLSFTAASADWVIDSKIDTAQGAMNITAKLKEQRARLDMNGPQGAMSTIVDSTTGDSTQLMHAQKMAVTVPGAIVKQQIEAMKAAAGASGEAGAAKATGEKEKVGEWDCEIYTWSSGTTSAKLWVASNVPNGESLKGAMAKLKAGAFGATRLGPDESLLPGPVVRTETTAGGQVTKMTVNAVKEEKLDASTFEVPADYKTMSLPGQPGATSPKPKK